MTTETAQSRITWDGIASGFDEFVTPLTMSLSEEALQRVELRPGMRFLEVAAGSGAMALPAARLGAQVLATDISPRMVERLGKRAQEEGLTNLEASVMDGTALQLESDSFEVTASQNGVSLFPDLAAGLREMVRVTRPGGKVLLVAFGSLAQTEFLTFFIRATKSVVPGFSGLPTDPPPLAFQLSDPERMRSSMAGAGLHDVDVQPVSWRTEFDSGAHLMDAVTSSNPIARTLVADLDEAQLSAIREALDEALAARAEASGAPVLNTELNLGVGTK